MTILTIQDIINRCKGTNSADVHNAKRINLWGLNLTNVSILSSFPNLTIISLSVNSLTSLEPFSKLLNLKELYLRKNLIAEIGELEHLRGLQGLNILWLDENPISELSDYRHSVLNILPQLTKLDDVEVTEDERALASVITIDDYSQSPTYAKQFMLANTISYQDLEEELFDKSLSDPSSDSNGALTPNSKWRTKSNITDIKNQIRSVSLNAYSSEDSPKRNNNVLLAVLALIRDLDELSLNIVNDEIKKMINKTYSD